MHGRTGSLGFRRQRGAAAVLAGAALLAMLTATMLAVEIGRMYSAHRQLQSLASMAAMDAVRVVGGCDRETPPSAGDVNNGVRQSLVRNGGDADALLGTGSSVDIGYLTTQDNLFRLTESEPVEAIAVGVTLTKPFPTPILGLFPHEEGQLMVARADAVQQVVGAVSVGSSLLTVDAATADLLDGLLSGLLGGSMSLSVATYEGLLNADLTLEELALAAGVATPGDFLALDLSAPGGLQVIGDALGASVEGGEAALAGTLDTLAAIVHPGRNGITFGELLAIEEGAEELVEQLPINTLELVMALAELAAEGYAVNIPLSLSVPGITTLGINARIGQARQIALGRPGFREDGAARTVARTSQIYLQLDVTVLDGSLPGGALLLLSSVAEVASASATLREVRCARSGRPYHEATVDVETALARVAIGRYNSLSAADPVIQGLGTVLNIPSLLRIRVDNPVIVDVGDSSASEDFEGPFVPSATEIDPALHMREVGTGVDAVLASAVNDLTRGVVDEISFSGLAAEPFNLLSEAELEALVATLLSPLFSVLGTVLEDLLPLQGIELGTATVTVQSMEAKPPVVFNQNET